LSLGDATVFFSGYLQNREALIATHVPHKKGAGDAEVVRALVEGMGVYLTVSALRGLFALVVQTFEGLWLAVDPAWGSVLYYHVDKKGGVLFANKISSLLTLVPAVPHITQDLWTFEFPVAAATMFEGIHQVPAQHIVHFAWGSTTPAAIRYWHPRVPLVQGSPTQSVVAFEQLLRQSAETCRRDNQGFTVSGGLDSAVLAALMRPEQVIVNTYEGYGDAFDELEYALAVAASIGAGVHYVRPTADDFRKYFPEIIRNLEGIVATFSPISNFMMAKKTQELGFSSCVFGHGPDELLSGYIRHLLIMYGAQHAGEGDLTEQFLGATSCHAYRPLAEYLWATPELAEASPLEQHLRVTDRSPTSGREQREQVTRYFNEFPQLPNSLGNVEFNLTYPAQMHMGASDATAFGLEAFCPYLDPNVMQFCFSVPHLKLVEGQTKWILREVGRRIGVPSSVTERADKKGLVVPATRWLQGPLTEWADELVRGLRRRLPHDPNVHTKLRRGEFDRQLYKLVSLELWFREFID